MPAILAIMPALAVLLWIGIEMPKKWRRKFFKFPVFVSSSAFALTIGAIGRGVLGPMTGFIAELILFPGLWFIRKCTVAGEKREAKRVKQR